MSARGPTKAGEETSSHLVEERAEPAVVTPRREDLEGGLLPTALLARGVAAGELAEDPLGVPRVIPGPGGQAVSRLARIQAERLSGPLEPSPLLVRRGLETELLLKSRRVVPRRLLDAGFDLEHPAWPAAAQDLVARWRERRSR